MEQIQADITSLSADSILRALGDASRTSCVNGIASLMRVRRPRFTRPLKKRCGAARLPTRCRPRFTIGSIDTPPTSGWPVFTSSLTIPVSPWFDDRSTPALRERRDDIARLAAEDARASLGRRFGTPSSWQWDRIHAVKFSHALSGGGRVLDWLFSRGPVPVDATA
jgi:hypothetical protein